MASKLTVSPEQAAQNATAPSTSALLSPHLPSRAHQRLPLSPIHSLPSHTLPSASSPLYMTLQRTAQSVPKRALHRTWKTVRFPPGFVDEGNSESSRVALCAALICGNGGKQK